MATTHALEDDSDQDAPNGAVGDGPVVEAVPDDNSTASSPSATPDDDVWWKEHGISAETREARGYIRYRPDELGAVAEAFSSCAPNQQEWALNQARECAGLVMPKHGVVVSDLLPSFPELEWPAVPPQLRPDEAIKKRTRQDHHPASDAWVMREHILRHKDHGGLTSKQRAALTDDQVRELLELHNVEEPHAHEEYAKYLLTITAREPLTHTHDDAYKTWKRRRGHVEKYHDGADVHGEHTHDDIMVKVADPKRSPGKRFDVNPLMRDALFDPYRTTELVFVCIEGSIKVDAITTAILATGLPAAAIAVPSVGQWDAAELPVLQYVLSGRRAVVVADADGRDNEQVMSHALLLRSELERMKVQACVALPPYAVYCANNEIKGVDDFLGSKHNGDLLDLEVVGHVLPPEFAQWAEEHKTRILYGNRIKKDAAEADIQTLKGIVLLAGPFGRTQASLQKVARYIGFDDSRVERAVKRLLMADEIEVDKPLSAAKWQYRSNTYRDPKLEWEDRPTIAIKNRALWALDTPVVALRDWLEHSKMEGLQGEEWESDGDAKMMRNELREAMAIRLAGDAMRLAADAMRLAGDGYDGTPTNLHISKKEPRTAVPVAEDPDFDRALDAWRDEK